MNRAILLVITTALATAGLSGCLGDDKVDTGLPRAVVTVTQLGEIEFEFDGTRSTGNGIQYAWDFGDGETATDPKVTHEFIYGDSTYTVTLLVTDATGVTARWTDDVVVGTGENTAPTAFFTPSARQLGIGEPLTVDARASTDPEDDPMRYEWDFNAVMTEDEYVAFRAQKDNVGDGSGDGGNDTDVTTDDKSGIDMADLERILDDPHGLTQKDVGHPGGQEGWDISLFEGRRSTTDPIFTLEEGYEDPVVYVVFLTVYDVKGASEEIVSQDAWAVEVVETKKKDIFQDEKSDIFVLGGDATYTNTTPEDEEGTVHDELTWPFTISEPVDLMYINVTWSQNDFEGTVQELKNDVDLRVTAPNGAERKVLGRQADLKKDGTMSMELDGADDFGKGKWMIQLYARNGYQIEYTVGYWAKVDINPFRALEEQA